MIIGIIFAIVFTFLLAKAIFETIWGACLILFGLSCHALAFVLRLLANAIRLWKRITGKTQKMPRRRMTLGESLIVVNSPDSLRAKRILASLR